MHDLTKNAALICKEEEVILMPTDNIDKRIYAVMEYAQRFMDIELIINSWPGVVEMNSSWDWLFVIDREFVSLDPNLTFSVVPYVKEQQH